MSDQPPSLDDLLLDWQERRTSGITVSAEELCAHCPELTTDLRRRIDTMLAMEAFLDMGQAAVGHDTRAVGEPGGPAELDFLTPPQGPDEIGRLGTYRVLRPLGVGGMGVVLLAEDSQLRRRVALKVMRRGPSATLEARQRFLREAQAAAALKDEHVVSIYQVGQDRDIPFLAMELPEGESLDTRLKREGRLPVAEAVRIGRETALGLAAAHAQGLVHRDIKPGNLWLEGKLGRVKILDFGLARRTDGDIDLTQTGAILGTPTYLAPEQARSNPVDGRADLFSLGVVMYRMLTGELPFRGKDTMATLLAVTSDAPKSLTELNADVPPALAALVQQLLAKRPEDRPASAQAVADTLAKIDSAPAPTSKPRLPLGRVAAAAVLLALLGGVFFVAGPGSRGPTSAQTQDIVPAPPPAAALGLDGLDPAKLPPTDRYDWRPPELVGLLSETRERHLGRVHAVAIRPDGKQAASSDWGGIIRLWDVATGRQVAVLPGSVGNALAYIDGGKRLVETGLGLVIWDLSGPEPVRVPPSPRVPGQFANMEITADGRTAAIQSLEQDGTHPVTIWDLSAEKPRQRLRVEKVGPRDPYPAVSSLSADGRRFAASNDMGVVRIWDLGGAEPKERANPLQAGRGCSLALSPDGRFLVTISEVDEGNARLWDLSKMEQEPDRVPVGFRATDLRFTQDGKRLLAGDGGRFKLFAFEAGRLGKEEWFKVLFIGGHSPRAQALTPDGRTLIAAEGACLRYWDLSVKPPRELRPFDRARYHMKHSSVPGLLAAPDQPRLFSSGADAFTLMWDLAGVSPQATVIRHPARLSEFSLAVAPDGRTLVSSGGDGQYAGSVGVWDVSRTPPRRKAKIPEYAYHAAFTPDGKRLALDLPNEITLWDMTLDPPLRKARLEIKGRHDGHGALSISADGQTLACIDGDNQVQLWNIQADPPVLRTTLKSEKPAHVLAFAPDRPLLAVGSYAEGTENWGTTIWDLSGPQHRSMGVLQSGNGNACVSFAPDGRSLATIDVTGTFLTVWDVASLAPRYRWSSTTQAFPDAAFAHDSRHLFILNNNGTVGVLRLPPALPPLDPKWVAAVARMPAVEQLKAAVAELRKRNPGFDGKVEHVEDLGKVYELCFSTDAVSDISPVRALKDLKVLRCRNAAGTGKLMELTALHGLPLQTLDISGNPVTNLAPLDGMPLTELDCSRTRVTDLTPLNLAPLQVLTCDVAPTTDWGILRQRPLREINGQPAAEFWKEWDRKQPGGAR